MDAGMEKLGALARDGDGTAIWAHGEITRLRDAIQPFAFLGSVLTGKEKDTNIFVGQVSPDGVHHPVTFGDLRRAAKIIYG